MEVMSYNKLVNYLLATNEKEDFGISSGIRESFIQ
jgi:hypothetical protein